MVATTWPPPKGPAPREKMSDMQDDEHTDVMPRVDGTPRLGRHATSAAGWGSLRVTLREAKRQTGLPRALRVLGSLNQKRGFDCPGCAWPDPQSRSFAEFCENGAKAVLDEATTRRIDARFFERHSIEELLSKSDRWLNDQGRLTEPMVLKPGSRHYEPISYEDAYALVAEALVGLDDPDRAVFYTSGRTSNEAAFLYQLMARGFGTNNLPDCSNLCHESSGAALKQTLGIGKGTVRLSDFSASDLIFVVGQNPATNHPRMLSALRDAKTAGAAIVSINPLREPGLVRFAHPQSPADLLAGGVALADEFVRVRVNGDLALFRGLNKALLEARAFDPRAIDEGFILEKTLGFDTFAACAQKTPWEQIETLSGVSRRELEALSHRARQAESIICCWAMGLTQHENAVATIQEVTNFLLLRGNVGRPGAGACPVRGHSNVQGDRTVGIATSMPEPFYRALERVAGVRAPRRTGLDTVGAIEKMLVGEARVLLALGGNFLSASPDTEYTARALRGCSLTAHVSTKLNRSHLVTGRTALILPCLGRTERDQTGGREQIVSVENSMGVVHASRGALEPAHPGLRSEPRLVAELAAELFRRLEANSRPSPSIDFESLGGDYDQIRGLIEDVVPGFGDYNRRVREPGGFELPNGPREGHFTTPSGKAEFVANEVDAIVPLEGELVLTTVRSHDQFNTTVYSEEDRYRGVSGSRRVLLMAREELERRQLEPGAAILVESKFRGVQRRVTGFVALPYDVPPGTAVAYFPEANALVPVDSFAKISRTPTSKSVRIRVERA